MFFLCNKKIFFSTLLLVFSSNASKSALSSFSKILSSDNAARNTFKSSKLAASATNAGTQFTNASTPKASTRPFGFILCFSAVFSAFPKEPRSIAVLSLFSRNARGKKISKLPLFGCITTVFASAKTISASDSTIL